MLMRLTPLLNDYQFFSIQLTVQNQKFSRMGLKQHIYAIQLFVSDWKNWNDL